MLYTKIVSAGRVTIIGDEIPRDDTEGWGAGRDSRR